MSNRAALSVIAVLLITVGLVLGLAGHSVRDVTSIDIQPQNVSCGSAFAPNHDLSTQQYGADLQARSRNDPPVDYRAECSDSLGAPRIGAFVAIGVGALALLFFLLTSAIGSTPVGEVDEVDESP